MAGRFGATIFLNILFGLIFLNAGGKDDSNPTNFSRYFVWVVCVGIVWVCVWVG